MEIGMVTDDITFVDVKWDVPRGIDNFNCSYPRDFRNPGISCILQYLCGRCPGQQKRLCVIKFSFQTEQTSRAELCTALQV